MECFLFLRVSLLRILSLCEIVEVQRGDLDVDKSRCETSPISSCRKKQAQCVAMVLSADSVVDPRAPHSPLKKPCAPNSAELVRGWQTSEDSKSQVPKGLS